MFLYLFILNFENDEFIFLEEDNDNQAIVEFSEKYLCGKAIDVLKKVQKSLSTSELCQLYNMLVGEESGGRIIDIQKFVRFLPVIL